MRVVSSLIMASFSLGTTVAFSVGGTFLSNAQKLALENTAAGEYVLLLLCCAGRPQSEKYNHYYRILIYQAHNFIHTSL